MTDNLNGNPNKGNYVRIYILLKLSVFGWVLSVSFVSSGFLGVSLLWFVMISHTCCSFACWFEFVFKLCVSFSSLSVLDVCRRLFCLCLQLLIVEFEINYIFIIIDWCSESLQLFKHLLTSRVIVRFCRRTLEINSSVIKACCVCLTNERFQRFTQWKPRLSVFISEFTDGEGRKHQLPRRWSFSSFSWKAPVIFPGHSRSRRLWSGGQGRRTLPEGSSWDGPSADRPDPPWCLWLSVQTGLEEETGLNTEKQLRNLLSWTQHRYSGRDVH